MWGRERTIPYKKLLLVIGILGIIIFLGYLIYPPQATGSISVNSVHQVQHISWWKYQGTTPMKIESVTADSHNITLKLKDYQDASQIIRVLTGDIASFSLSLIPVSSSLKITPAERTLPYWNTRTIWNEYPIAGSIGGNAKPRHGMLLTLQDFNTTW